MRILILCAVLLGCGAMAWAQQSEPGVQAPLAAEDPAIEARLKRLAEELRCLVCQNESLAGSNAELAIDLKNQIREQLRAGKSEREVIDYLVARYGDFVLYRPPLKASTIALWVGPFVLLLAGVVFMLRQLSARQRMPEQASAVPSAVQLERAQRLLSEATAEPANSEPCTRV